MLKKLNRQDVKLLIVHCSATRCDRPFTTESLIATGKARFGQPSYHYYIRMDGDIVPTLPENIRGAHARNYNRYAIGICYEGGLDANGQPADTRTEAQKEAMFNLLSDLRVEYPDAHIIGHCELPKQRVPIDLILDALTHDDSPLRQLPRVAKACPCFLPSTYYATLQPRSTH